MITKIPNDDSEYDFAAGEAILIDKQEGVSSFYIVKQVRRIVNVKKVGHAGTLDPFASGLLIVCTGKMTKQISSFQNLEKGYEGSIILGKKTLSADPETEIIEERNFSFVTDGMIIETAKSFLGESEQIPPMFSALKHKGKPLYKYARKGEVVDRAPRKINISSFEIIKIELPEIRFRLTCSKGAYVRVIADDFGTKLGTVALLGSLRRTSIGSHLADDALTVNEFAELVNYGKNN